MRPDRSSHARLSSPAVLHQAWLCSNCEDPRLSSWPPRDHDDQASDYTESSGVISLACEAFLFKKSTGPRHTGQPAELPDYITRPTCDKIIETQLKLLMNSADAICIELDAGTHRS